MAGKTLLIDGDILIYQGAAVCETSIEWEDGIVSSILTEDVAKHEMEVFINHLLDKCKAKDFILCLSSDYNFRYLVDDSYKKNRVNVKRPVLLEPLKQYAKETFPCREEKWLEADDVMGIIATSRPNTIICTLDKDLNQIPGLHYNWRRGELYGVTKEEGDAFFYQQVLTGDPTDGYPGCPGIGPVKARKALEDSPDPWDTVVSVYELAGLTEAHALSQARLAKILTTKEWDYTNKTYKLWGPSR